MKKILVLFATVVVMMMVTGCENPADVHIPTQEELWVAEGYRYCGNIGYVGNKENNPLKTFFEETENEYELTEDGKYYVKFPLNEKSVANNVWQNDVNYHFCNHIRICIFKNESGELYKLVIEDENNPLY